jgi:hypothetical protein
MRKSKRLNETIEKEGHLDLLRMTKESYGTKEESVYPTSRKSRTSYFEKHMILLTLFTPRGNKMYQDLKVSYLWYGIKREAVEYVALCDTSQRVKAEHQCPAGLLQPLKVP